MISALQSSSSANDTSHLDLVLTSLKVEFNTCLSVHTPDTSVNGTSANGPFSLLSHSYSTIHVDRVAAADRHDTDTWTQDRKVHDTWLDAVAASSSLGSNGTASSDCSPVNVAMNCSTLMELQTQGPQVVNQVRSVARPESALLRPHDCTFFGTPASDVRPNITTPQQFHEDLFEGRRRVAEILVRCGVIHASGTSRIESTSIGCGDTPPIDARATSNVAAETHIGENDDVLIPALADWTSKWVHKLVIQPYLQGNFHFKYQRKPGGASVSILSRIRRVLSDVHNPVQVAVHALWFISTLTGNGTQENAPFLSVPIFRYLHNNGTFVAEDFMFRTFIICAMIGDKTMNDTPLSTSAWCRLTRISLVILNSTERYALSCLKWNTVMTPTEWQDTIIFLRSCIKMSSVFDPFAYDEASPSGVMARCLDKLINFSYKNETTPQQAAQVAMQIIAPQPVRHFTHWEVFDTTEWCPEDDPVINQKPRTIGIAPGADQNPSTLKVGTTAKDLLDSILGSSRQAIIGSQGWWSFWRQPPLVYDLV